MEPPALKGIRVLSTAANVPGPVAAAMLRDMGASVVKVEPPFGDPLAAAAPEWYAELCAGIEILKLDLKHAHGRAQVAARLEETDVLLTASRPASLERLGLDWPSLHARHPRLCHVAIIGYPAPRQDEAGHDLTYQSDAGLVAPPALPQTLIADLSGAQRAVIAALGLLLARDRTGEAGRADVTLSDAAAAFAPPARHRLTTSGGWLGGGLAAYNVYRASNGWVAVAALEPQFRRMLAQGLGIDVEDRQAMAGALATRTAEEWDAWGRERGLPLASVRGVVPEPPKP
jgi:crotonobetainyl-CoA:carnitine CoA-transferase CaiB-like acyl-CoA transferase